MKRIVLLSTNFYPTPVVGAVRITNWARMLPELGYEPLAICRDYGYRATPNDLANHVHPQVKVLPFKNNGEIAIADDSVPLPLQAKPIMGRGKSTGLVSSLLCRCIIPDSQLLYWKRIYPYILARVRDYQPDVILTSAPSFSVHEVGRWLKRDLKTPWVADYRDPMLLDERFRPRGAMRMLWSRYVACENRVYAEADAIVHAIPLHARWARLHYQVARSKCALLRHPVPVDLVRGEVTPLKSQTPGRRSVNVVGYIRPQVAGMLSRAIMNLVTESPHEFDLEFRIIGRELDNPDPLKKLLGERLIIPGRVRHDLAKQHIAGADVLVNAVSEERQRATNISSKLYEYAAARKPIIAINPTCSDRLLLKELFAWVVNHPNVKSLETALKGALAADPAKTSSSYQGFLAKESWQRHALRFRLILDYAQGAREAIGDLRSLETMVPIEQR